MAKTQRQRIGKWGEDLAAQYLEQQGYCILARNARTRSGEIDLIARSADRRLVFVEVKTRTNTAFGYPEEAVDARKLEHLFLAADIYLFEHSDLTGEDWQVDVIAIQGRPGENHESIHIEHFQHIGS